MATEKRLIDANNLIAVMKEMYCDGCKNHNGIRCRACYFDSAMSDIEDAPTVDAVPVVHGRWIDRTKNIRGFYDYRYDCSVCEHIFWHGGIENFNYCPNCGAKMDGDGNG